MEGNSIFNHGTTVQVPCLEWSLVDISDDAVSSEAHMEHEWTPSSCIIVWWATQRVPGDYFLLHSAVQRPGKL